MAVRGCRQSLFQRLPRVVRETVHTVNRRASPRVYAAVQRFVPFSRLLPLRPPISFDHSRHQLLGRDLPEVFFSVLRERAVPGRIWGSAFFGGPLQVQPAEPAAASVRIEPTNWRRNTNLSAGFRNVPPAPASPPPPAAGPTWSLSEAPNREQTRWVHSYVLVFLFAIPALIGAACGRVAGTAWATRARRKGL